MWDVLFLSAPTPILGGAKEKFCIGNWGCRGRISGPEFIGTIDDRVQTSKCVVLGPGR